LAWALNSNVPVRLAATVLDPLRVGQFAGVYMFLTAAIRCVVPVAQYVMVNVARSRHQGSRFYRNAVLRYWTLGAVASVAAFSALGVIALYADDILPLVYTSEYVGLNSALVACAFASAMGVGASFVSYFLALRTDMAFHLLG